MAVENRNSWPVRTAVACAIGLSGSWPAIAAAQGPQAGDADVSTDGLEVVLVTGQRAAIQRAREEERLADILVNVVSADATGQFGDQNTAEALQRLPGVTIDRNEGEGRTISVRGLPSSFTQVTLNGVRVGTSEAEDATVSLDLIPADQFASLAIAKTYTPDMDGDAIGGSVDLRGISAFGLRGDLTTFSAEASYNEYASSWNPKLAASLTRRFRDDKIGLALSFNYYDRSVEGDDLRNEDDAGLLTRTVNGTTFYYPGEVNQRFEIGQRERVGGSFNLEFRPTDTAQYFLRGQYNTLKDDDIRVQNQWQLERATNAEVLSIDQTQGEFRDVRVRYQTFFQPTRDTLSTVSAGGTHKLAGKHELSYQFDFSRSNWDQEDGVRGRYQIDDIIVSASWADDTAAILGTRRDGTRPDPADLAQYQFLGLLFIEEERIDDVATAQVNYRRELDFGDRPGFLKTGFKFRDRDKTADKSEFDGDPRTVGVLSNYSAVNLFAPNTRMRGMGQFQQLNEARDLFFQARDALLASPTFQRQDRSVQSDLAQTEQVTALYLMAGADVSDKIKLIGGVRVEWTEFTSAGSFLASNESGVGPTGAAPLLVDLGTARRTYADALPSLTLRYEPGDEWVARLSYGRAIKRPDFQDTRNLQYLNIENGVLTAGNPKLNALVADQFDASVAWYPNRNTTLQVALFHKKMTDFFIDQTTTGLAGSGISLPPGVTLPVNRVVTTVNGSEAEVSGAEISFFHNLVALPGALSGLFVEGNLTLATSEATISSRPGETFPFPQQADFAGNLSLGWENETFSARASVTHTGERLQGVGDVARPFEDRYRAAYTQVDVNLRWNINDTVQLYADGINLNDAKETRFYTGPDYGNFYERVQDFGATYQLGVRAKF